MRRGTRFKDLPLAGQIAAALAIAVSVAIVVSAERDIHRHPPDQLRGSKRVWRVVCLNALGAIVYFRWGRQPRP